jgi:dihydrofolate reductase
MRLSCGSARDRCQAFDARWEDGRAAGGRDVRIGGGVSTILQFLAAGLIDEMHLAFTPVFSKVQLGSSREATSSEDPSFA